MKIRIIKKSVLEIMIMRKKIKISPYKLLIGTDSTSLKIKSIQRAIYTEIKTKLKSFRKDKIIESVPKAELIFILRHYCKGMLHIKVHKNAQKFVPYAAAWYTLKFVRLPSMRSTKSPWRFIIAHA